MKLNKKKELAARTLGVGKGRIWFNPARLADIKEAITKQDIRDLLKDKAIKVKTITGKLKKGKKRRRREGKIKKKVKRGKEEYMIMIRKMRKYLKWLKDNKKISREDYLKLRKRAKAGMFHSIEHLKDSINSMSANKT